MELKLYKEDLLDEYKDIGLQQTKFEHFKPLAQEAIKLVREATFIINKGAHIEHYNMIYAPGKPTYSICNAIGCPAITTSGCSHYSTSAQCHLLIDRRRDEGEEFYQKGGITFTEYELFASGNDRRVNIEQLKLANKEYFSQPQVARIIARRKAFAEHGK